MVSYESKCSLSLKEHLATVLPVKELCDEVFYYLHTLVLIDYCCVQNCPNGIVCLCFGIYDVLSNGKYQGVWYELKTTEKLFTFSYDMEKRLYWEWIPAKYSLNWTVQKSTVEIQLFDGELEAEHACISDFSRWSYLNCHHPKECHCQLKFSVRDNQMTAGVYQPPEP